MASGRPSSRARRAVTSSAVGRASYAGRGRGRPVTGARAAQRPVVDLAVGQPRQVGQHDDLDPAWRASPAASAAARRTASASTGRAPSTTPTTTRSPASATAATVPASARRALDAVEVDAQAEDLGDPAASGRRPPRARRGVGGPGRRCAARPRSRPRARSAGDVGVAHHHVGAAVDELADAGLGPSRSSTGASSTAAGDRAADRLRRGERRGRAGSTPSGRWPRWRRTSRRGRSRGAGRARRPRAPARAPSGRRPG